MQEKLEPRVSISKHRNASNSLRVTVADVILTSDQDFYWTFSGLNVYFNHCELNSPELQFMKDDDSENTREIPTIMINNSSLRSLDLHSETRAEIIGCYINAQNESRPTLIKANNSHIVIKNSEFLNFVNENGSTIVNGENNCSISVENSVFAEHYSKLSVFYIHDNCQMKIRNTIFKRNRAKIKGGATRVESHSRISVIDCYFDDNSAKYGGATYGDRHVTLEISSTEFNNNKASGFGGAICIHNEVQLLIRNSSLDGNTADRDGGAIWGGRDVTLEINNTQLNNNKASDDGGAI